MMQASVGNKELDKAEAQEQISARAASMAAGGETDGSLKKELTVMAKNINFA